LRRGAQAMKGQGEGERNRELVGHTVRLLAEWQKSEIESNTEESIMGKSVRLARGRGRSAVPSGGLAGSLSAKSSFRALSF
jgi:hypothetical protein